MNLVGNQADDLKYRLLSCRSGAWKGKIMHTHPLSPMKLTTGKKLNKFKSGVQCILEQGAWCEVDVPICECAELQDLELIHRCVQWCPCILKRLFNAIEAFIVGRDSNGWHVQVYTEAEFGPNLLDYRGLTNSWWESSMKATEELELGDASNIGAAVWGTWIAHHLWHSC